MTRRERGETGRRNGLKIRRLRSCGFDPRRSHHGPSRGGSVRIQPPVGVTAGASAPEPLVEAVVQALKDRFDVTLADDPGERETVTFKLPRALTS